MIYEVENLSRFEALRQEHPDYPLIDVRSASDYQTGHLPGAVHIPEAEILDAVEDWDHRLPVLVYCNRGMTSRRVLERLEAAGFETLYNLTGGLKG